MFIVNFPDSDSLERVTDLVLELNNKLEKKYFENAKLYYDTGKYKSAIFAIDYFLGRHLKIIWDASLFLDANMLDKKFPIYKGSNIL